MPRRKNYKVGDRVYFELFDSNDICSSVITGIRDMCDDIYGDGKKVNYKMFDTGPLSSIEDYMCLPESDPRVVEYIKSHKTIFELEDKLKRVLDECNAQVGDPIVTEVLYNLYSRYEKC